MTKKDLFRILIKLGGILILINSLPTILGQLAIVWGTSGMVISMVILTLFFTIAFTFWLIFGTDSVIQLFKLDKGYDNNEVKVDQLKAETSVSFAVLIIGGMFILHSFSPLLIELIRIVKIAAGSDPVVPSLEQASYVMLIVHIAEFCAGYLLISNYSRVARFLASRNKNNSQPE